MKKIISLILTLLLVVSVLSVGSFSALGGSSVEVTSVSLTGTNAKRPLSKAEIDSYIKYGYDSDIDDDGVTDIYLSAFERYNFSLKLSNGKSVELNSKAYLYTGFCPIDDNNFALVSPYVSGADYKKAVKNDSKSIYAKVYCAVYNAKLSELSIDKMLEIMENPSFEKTFKVKIKLVDRYVTKLKAVSGVPKSVYKNADYVALEKAKFSVTYYTGTTKTYTVKRNSPIGDIDIMEPGEWIDEYTLNNEAFYCEIGKDKLCFDYADAPTAYTSVKVNPCPYKKIEIKDCTFADDVNGYGKGVKTLSCDITQTNGKVVNITAKFDNPSFMGVAAELNGYYLNYMTDSASMIPEFLGGNTIVEVDFAGFGDEFNSSESSDATLLSKIIAKFEAVINILENLLYSIYLPL
ncbi:MAG: hypothetical protein ACI4SB_09670 [Acutalibacteraceae bacterium]